MATPLYTKLREASSTLYVLPGAVEDFSAADQQPFYNIRPSHFALIRIPNWGEWKDRVSDGSVFDETTKVFPGDLRDGFVDLMRSYVANRETVRRETVDNNGKFTYDPGNLETLAEKNFLKMMHEIGILQFEIADKNVNAVDWDLDESLANPNFPANAAPPDHYNQQLWKERDPSPVETTEVRLIRPPAGVSVPFGNPDDFFFFDLQFSSQTRYRTGDRIGLRNVENLVYETPEVDNGKHYFIEKFKRDPQLLTDPLAEDELVARWVRIAIPKDPNVEPVSRAFLQNEVDNLAIGTYDFFELGPDDNNLPMETGLVYEKIFKYVGEIQATSSIQEANRAFSLSTAYIPETSGASPDILFMTRTDSNYRPGDNWPNESQIQEEILGAEQVESPINIMPDNYPGDEKALFDKLENQTTFAGKYLTPDGDRIRRNGGYFGNIIPEGRQFDDAFVLDYESYPQDQIDGLGIDFDLRHYHKAVNREDQIVEWDVFNQTNFNNERPKPFEFNAVLWYYVIEYDNGSEIQSYENLGGITILGDPADDGFGLAEDPDIFPVQKKLVSRANAQGTAFILQKNRSFLFNTDNTPVPYSDLSSQEAFNIDAYEETLQMMYQTNELFTFLTGETLAAQSAADNATTNWRSLASQLNTAQTQIGQLRQSIIDIENMQMRDSNTIEMRKLKSLGQTVSELTNVTPNYGLVLNNTLSSYGPDRQGLIPLPDGLATLINLTNDDLNTIDHETQSYGILLSANNKVGQSITFRMGFDVETEPDPRRIQVFSQDVAIASAWAPSPGNDPEAYGNDPDGMSLLSTGYNTVSGSHVISLSAQDVTLLSDRLSTGSWVYLYGKYRSNNIWYEMDEMMSITSFGTNDLTLQQLRSSIGDLNPGVDKIHGKLYIPSMVELTLTRIRPIQEGEPDVAENWQIDRKWM